jgi:hypothetical protein
LAAALRSRAAAALAAPETKGRSEEDTIGEHAGRQLWDRAGVGGRRAPDPDGDERGHPGALRFPPDDAVRLARATIAAGRDARPLLYLKGRSHKRPGGARASSSRMAKGPGAHWRLGALARGRAAGGGDGIRGRGSEGGVRWQMILSGSATGMARLSRGPSRSRRTAHTAGVIRHQIAACSKA